MTARMIHVSVRESRMCVDRILLVARCLPGYVSAVRDCVLLSQALGLGGFEHLLRHYERLRMASLEAVAVTDDAAGAMIDAGGMHAWLVAPAVADIGVDIARRCGRADLRVRGVEERRELATVCALMPRYGAAATYRSEDAGGATLLVTNASPPRTAAQWDPLLHHAFRHGSAVDEALWRSVYALSNSALAPDSVVSRRHAGPVILKDDGTLFGRVPQDDDFDPNMLRNVARTPQEHS